MKWLKLFENFSQLKNIIIVGGGISGLYTAYKLKKKFPEVKFKIIEKEKECGGRIRMGKIDDVYVPSGAQFSRLDKDKNLKNLLKELDINVDPYKIQIDYSFEKHKVNNFIKKLEDGINKYDRSKLTFKDYAKNILGEDYEKFVNMMGYTDFENYDFKDAIKNYGLDDNLPGYDAANIPWNEVIEKMIKFVGKRNILTDTEIKSIKKEKSGFIVNNEYPCDGIVFALPVKCLRKILDDKIYDDIESQNFLKVFAKTDNLKSVKKYTVVDSELRKVIPVEKDVYTITFCDNKDARKLKDKEKSFFEKTLSEHFDTTVKLTNLKKFFHEEGTHYFKPLNKKWKSRKDFIEKAQNPQKNIWVVGEMVAEKQGWVEGALSSVENISLFK